MNAQEEDRQKTSCSGRGFGLAAVAVGVGVGAALYYIFNKRPENPHTEGSTSEWNCERSPTFRERSWTLEECSICFEVMLRGEEVMALPCTHNFHTHCILPWLQEKQTCPNCRKTAQ